MKLSNVSVCYMAGITTVQLVPISYADTKQEYPPTTVSSHVPASTVKAYMQQFRDRKLSCLVSHLSQTIVALRLYLLIYNDKFTVVGNMTVNLMVAAWCSG